MEGWVWLYPHHAFDISEHAAVDKVIIAQDSLRDFINYICPGAYISLTKVDFKALDNFSVKPIGIYGSREEIARFLTTIQVINGSM